MTNFIFLLSVFFAQASFALTKDEIKSEIQTRMHERHPSPSGDFWTQLGPDALPVIEEMYQASKSPIEQSWLIDGMSHFSDPSVATLLESSIKGTDNDVSKKKMLSALIQSQGESSFDFVEPFLKDKDPHVRLAVASGIQNSMPGTAPQARLTRFKDEESEAWVKEDLKKATETPPVLMKRADRVFEQKNEVVPVKALTEKEWAGEWTGVYISGQKPKSAVATLTAQGKTWKVMLKLPKQSKYTLPPEAQEVLYYQSARMHWIEIRNKKEDAVFIGSRKQ